MPIAPVGAIETGREPSSSFATRLHRAQNQNAPLRVRLALFIAHRPHEDARDDCGRAAPGRSNWLSPSGFEDIMRVSSKTSMPSSSHASSNSGVGGLCEVRRHCSPSPAACGCGSTAPRPAALRLCPHGPGGCRSLSSSPACHSGRSPSARRNATVRMPNRVS